MLYLKEKIKNNLQNTDYSCCLPFLFHPEVHAPIGERHAKGDAHHNWETLF